MPQDGQSTNTTTSAPTSKRASTKSASTKEQVAQLKGLQDKIYALMGLKMAVDKLRDLKYDVVLAQEEGGACTIKITLGVKYDLLTGLVEGRDIWEVQTAIDEQIKKLEAK